MSEQTIAPADMILPSTLTIIPLMGRPIFPGIFTPVMINAANDIKIIEKMPAGDSVIGIVMIKNDADDPTLGDMYTTGTVARIQKKINLPDGSINVYVSTLRRFKITRPLSDKVPMIAAVQYLEDEEDDTPEVKALTRALISEMKLLSENNPLFSEEIRLNVINIDHPGKIADFIASILNIEPEEQQRILEITNVRKRMENVLVHIKKEQELFRIQKKIQNEINTKIEKNQREYFLKEELKSIKEELGLAADAKSSDYQKFKSHIEEFQFTGEVKETVENELEKFSLLEPNSPEYTISRTYLETVTQLPWNDTRTESYDIDKAQKQLDKDHYGLDDVKKRIIEYLAVRKLKNDNKGSIILLVGPPGVGKTSIGHSIAAAMNKKFYRFSVGGMHDEAEIRGHRRTYIGAMPGKIIQGLKITKSSSPVFMIDEIDKMGQSNQGDPSSALLEVLDPEQNVSFRDNYLDVPFDLSHIVFVLTANTLDSIPSPLLDRAEIIRLSGYIDSEKLEIARGFLVPRCIERNGLKRSQIKFPKQTLLDIANQYAREAGVRNFEKNLDKICRAYATELVIADSKNAAADTSTAAGTADVNGTKKAAEQAETAQPASKKSAKTTKTSADKKAPQPTDPERFEVTPDVIQKYLGKPVFRDDDIKQADKPGTAIGLAWTSMGGDTLLLECTSFAGKADVTLTGQMGDVMKESAAIAWSWVKNYTAACGQYDSEWFDKHTVHLHIPEGATPKDGPSAGITMAVTFLSMLKNKPIVPRLAMTGELSLTGHVMPIGGLKEKTIAAHRNKIKDIIIPAANERDLDEIPDYVKKAITFHPVSRMEEVAEICFPSRKKKKD